MEKYDFLTNTISNILLKTSTMYPIVTKKSLQFNIKVHSTDNTLLFASKHIKTKLTISSDDDNGGCDCGICGCSDCKCGCGCGCDSGGCGCDKKSSFPVFDVESSTDDNKSLCMSSHVKVLITVTEPKDNTGKLAENGLKFAFDLKAKDDKPIVLSDDCECINKTKLLFQ